MKTKAAVLYEYGKPLVIEELELSPPKENEVLIKMTASGICHSDLSMTTGKLPMKTPCVPGHEGAGVIEEVGPGVTNLKVGDHVICSLSPSCGKCVMCTSGMMHMCTETSSVIWDATMVDGTRRLKKGDVEIGQAICLGTFAERAVIPAGSAIKVAHNAPLDTVCLIGCGVTTGVGAALNTVSIKPGDSVAIIGGGGVGLSIMQGAKIAGATTIIMIDPVEEKRELALSLGATDVVDPFAGDPVKTVRKLSKGGVHFAFEALGRKETIEQSWGMVRLTGTAVIVGVPALDTVVDVPVVGFFAGRRMKGSFYGSSNPPVDLPKYVDLYQSGELKLDEMITQRIPLEDVNRALDEMSRGEGARSVIMYDM